MGVNFPVIFHNKPTNGLCFGEEAAQSTATPFLNVSFRDQFPPALIHRRNDQHELSSLDPHDVGFRSAASPKRFPVASRARARRCACKTSSGMPR